MPCVVNTTFKNITTSKGCDKGGVRYVYPFKVTDLDLDAMTLAYVAADRTVPTLIFNTGFVEPSILVPAPRTAQGNATYTNTASEYDVLFQLVFEGTSKTNSVAITELIGCCDLGWVAYDSNCNMRIYGIEWDGAELVASSSRFEVVRHLEATGVKGGDGSRDELDLGGQQDGSALYLDLTNAAFKTAFITA